MKAMKRVTRSRALGMSTEQPTGARWAPDSYAAGAYEVWSKGDRIAIVTDKWMADTILSALAEGGTE